MSDPAPPLTFYMESTWMSPWGFHAMVALEELGVPYRVEVVSVPISDARRRELQTQALVGKLPILAHGERWLSESLAISLYLAEAFPAPAHPRLFPADPMDRARAYQVLSVLRTSLGALRDDRPTSNVFGRPAGKPLSDKGQADAHELVRIANALIAPGQRFLFGDAWCVADADLALALMRLVATQDPVPKHLIDYAVQQFDRKSVRRFVSHLPTSAT